ncbi:transcription initiation factor IIB-like [Tripterygium wilfordii]|uniref:transcription initiation factor IIB-like n=1 Tax=Tripterygium wilfordii TaxID=458696 RepID=UPI0018F8137A|nr:transcription initiation factor IIB-like [Tripterygium wilfordii]
MDSVYSSFCPECNKKNTEIVLDHAAGDTICSECGLVLEDRCLDEGCEWRIFTDDNNDNDPKRVGAAIDPLLSNSNLSTFISTSNRGGATAVSDSVLNSSLARFQNHKLSANNDNLIKGFEAIQAMADGLSIQKNIVIRAKEIYKKIDDERQCRGRNQSAVFGACLFIACREVKLPRTLKEISVVANGSTKKEINRASEQIKKTLDVETGTLHAGDLVRRFCSHLGMKNQEISVVQETLQKSEELDIRRSPKSVLAAIIYMISQLSDNKKPIQDISSAAEVAEGTIKKSYKDLYPYASRIIPNRYANEEQVLQKLCQP